MRATNHRTAFLDIHRWGTETFWLQRPESPRPVFGPRQGKQVGAALSAYRNARAPPRNHAAMADFAIPEYIVQPIKTTRPRKLSSNYTRRVPNRRQPRRVMKRYRIQRPVLIQRASGRCVGRFMTGCSPVISIWACHCRRPYATPCACAQHVGAQPPAFHFVVKLVGARCRAAP